MGLSLYQPFKNVSYGPAVDEDPVDPGPNGPDDGGVPAPPVDDEHTTTGAGGALKDFWPGTQGGGGDGGASGVEGWYNIFQSLNQRQAPVIPKGPQWNMESDPIWLQLNEAISGALKGGTTFDKDTIERMKGAARIRSENLRDQGTARVRANVISRGLQDSPLGASLEAEADRAADADYQATSTQIEVQATVQNYKDRMGALDRAERLLNSKMSYVLALANNDIQRAEIALAYRRIDEARNALDKQLSAQLYGMQAGFEFQKEFFNLQLPLLIAQLGQGQE